MKFDENFGSIPFSPKLDGQCSDEERADTAVLMRMRSGLLYDFTCKVRGTLLFESHSVAARAAVHLFILSIVVQLHVLKRV